MHFIKELISATHPNSASWSLLLKQPGHLRRGPAAEQQQTSKCPCSKWPASPGGERRVHRLQQCALPSCARCPPAPCLPARCRNGAQIWRPWELGRVPTLVSGFKPHLGSFITSQAKMAGSSL